MRFTHRKKFLRHKYEYLIQLTINKKEKRYIIVGSDKELDIEEIKKRTKDIFNKNIVKHPSSYEIKKVKSLDKAVLKQAWVRDLEGKEGRISSDLNIVLF